MTDPIKMTREQMQTEALIIETLLDAAQAIGGSDKPYDSLEIIEMARTRAKKLNAALDSVNAPDIDLCHSNEEKAA